MKILIIWILIIIFILIGTYVIVFCWEKFEEFLKTREKEEKEECGDSFKRSLK